MLGILGELSFGPVKSFDVHKPTTSAFIYEPVLIRGLFSAACVPIASKQQTTLLNLYLLDLTRNFIQYKLWIKPNVEMPFLYGNHVLKAHIGRITEDTPEHQGVVVLSMGDMPLVSFL